jgi:hypothetical protein
MGLSKRTPFEIIQQRASQVLRGGFELTDNKDKNFRPINSRRLQGAVVFIRNLHGFTRQRCSRDRKMINLQKRKDTNPRLGSTDFRMLSFKLRFQSHPRCVRQYDVLMHSFRMKSDDIHTTGPCADHIFQQLPCRMLMAVLTALVLTSNGLGTAEHIARLVPLDLDLQLHHYSRECLGIQTSAMC